MSRYSVGLRNVGSYKVSGQPYITGSAVNAGSEVKIEFPFVTKNITIRIPSPPNAAMDNRSAGIRFQTLGGPFDLGGAGKPFTISLWHKNTATQAEYLNKNKGPLAFLVGGGVVDAINTPRPAYTAVSGSFRLQSGGESTSIAGALQWFQPNGNDNWYHLLITQHTASTTSVYTNGVFRTSLASDRPNWDGLAWPRNGSSLLSSMDEIVVWDDGFTQEEAEELYNSGEHYNPLTHSKKANLIAWYQMGDHHLDSPGPLVGSTGAQLYDAIDSNDDPFPMFDTEDGFTRAAATVVEGPFTSQTTGKLRVHMLSTTSSPHGANVFGNKHYQELQGYGSTITLPMKTKEIYLSGVDAQVTFEVIAELTNIPTNSMYALTGSGIDE